MTTLLLAVTFACAGPPTDKAALFKDCMFDKGGKDDNRPPESLQRTYAAFVASVKGGGQAKFCLSSVEVTDKEDPKRDDFGTGINIPWMKVNFRADVVVCEKQSDDTFLLRTGTSATWWVQTRSGEWKLFKYLDKPIQ